MNQEQRKSQQPTNQKRRKTDQPSPQVNVVEVDHKIYHYDSSNTDGLYTIAEPKEKK